MKDKIDVLAALNRHVVLAEQVACHEQQAEAHAVFDAVSGLFDAAKGMLPKNVCLTNPNIPDETKLPLTATMGELRSIASALARIGASQ